MIWYSPNVFGKAWLGYVYPGGLPEHADMDKTPFVLSGLTALVTMYLLNQAQLYFAIVTVVDAIELAAVMSVFVMAQSIPNYVFGGKSLDELAFFFKAGMEARTVTATKANEASSPAHTIFTLYVTRRQELPDGEVLSLMTKLTFADLAGTQREYAKRKGLDAVRHENDGTSAAQERERRKINLALQTLGLVIHSLATGREPPYRQSVLSMLLSQSLGGNSKTFFLATVLPTNLKLSLRTLKDAEFVMRIRNNAVRGVMAAGGGAFLTARVHIPAALPPLSMAAAWSLIADANRLLEAIGEPLTFSLEPHDEVSLRYPYAVRASCTRALLHAHYDPDSFETALQTLHLLHDGAAPTLNAFGARGSRIFHPAFPFYLAPERTEIGRLAIDVSHVVASSSRTSKLVSGTFARAGLAIAALVHIDPTSVRSGHAAAASTKPEPPALAHARITDAELASISPLGVCHEPLADALRAEGTADLEPGAHATLHIRIPALEQVPGRATASLVIHATLGSTCAESLPALPHCWQSGDAFDGMIALPVRLDETWFDATARRPAPHHILHLAVTGTRPIADLIPPACTPQTETSSVPAPDPASDRATAYTAVLSIYDALRGPAAVLDARQGANDQL